MKVKPPKKTITVELEEHEVDRLIKAYEEVAAIYEAESNAARRVFRETGTWPVWTGQISNDTLIQLNNLARAFRVMRSA